VALNDAEKEWPDCSRRPWAAADTGVSSHTSVVPFGLSQQQFVARYRRCLDRASAHLIAELRTLFDRPVPSTVKTAEVEIFLGEDGLGRPSAWIYYSGENNRVDRSDLSIFPGRSLELSIGLESIEEFDDRYFTNKDFGGLPLAANTLKAWFAECWWKAGGWSYPVPTKVSIHDGFGDGRSIQLSTDR